MIDCPSEETLQQFLNEQFDTVDSSAVTEHVENCRRCQEIVERLVALPADLRSYADQASATSTVIATPSKDSSSLDHAGLRQIGPYTVEKEIGRGGMGVVLRVRDQHFDRALAVKILKGHIDDTSSDLIRRFHEESQIMGRLQHPGIPPVHDRGERDDGRPWFTMKLIHGQTLSSLLKERLNSAEDLPRFLGIFEQVCQTLAYVHSQGIIHRDLKPSNIMVGTFGEVQVMDWGLAKNIGTPVERKRKEQEGIGTPNDLESHEPNDANCEIYPCVPGLQNEFIETQFPSSASRPATVPGRIMGTLGYMAPEQARGEIDQLDERCDVFSLGAILCVLLTGEPPFTGPKLQKTTTGDLADAFVRLEASGADAELVRLAKSCLTANVHERPRDAGVVATAVKRYQIQVQERLRLAELTKARARVLLMMAAVVLLVFGVGIVGTMWGLVQTDIARRKAVAATKQANKRLKQVENGSEILADIFRDLDLRKIEKQGQKLHLVLGERLKRAAQQLKGEAIADPVVTAKLQNTLAVSLMYLGHFKEAVPLLRESLVTQQKVRGADHPDTLTCMRNLARSYQFLGQLKKALPLYEKALKLTEAKYGVDHTETLYSMNYLAMGLEEAGYLKKALALSMKAVKIAKEKRGDDHPHTYFSIDNLASAYHALGQWNKAITLYEQTFKSREKRLGADHPHTLAAMSNLAMTYRQAGHTDKALPLFKQTLKLRKANLGDDHPSTLESLNNLAVAYLKVGQMDKAIPLLEHTLSRRKVILIADHPDIYTSMNNLALGYKLAGKRKLALSLYTQAYQHSKIKLGINHPNTLTTMNNLAMAYRASGHLEKALPLFEQTLKLSKAKLGFDHPDTLHTMNSLARAYRKANQLDKALPLFEQTLKSRKARLGADHVDTLVSMHNLALGYVSAGQLGKAMTLNQRTFKLRKAKLGIDHPDTLDTMHSLALNYRDAAQFDKAFPLFEQTLKLRKANLGDDHPDTIQTMAGLAVGYRGADQLGKAVSLLEQTHKLLQAKRGNDHPNTLLARADLSVVYMEAGRFQEAETTLEDTLQRLPQQHRLYKTLLRLLPKVQRLKAREQRLPIVLAGGPSTNLERMQLAELCVQYLKRYQDAAKLYQYAFENAAKLAENLQNHHRINAVCAAVLAAVGQDKHGIELSKEQQQGLQTQAQNWLQADLTLCRKLLKSNPCAAHSVHERMQIWRNNKDLLRIRDAKSLATLPPTVSKRWHSLWAEVEILHKAVKNRYDETVVQGQLTTTDKQYFGCYYQEHKIKLVKDQPYSFDLSSKHFDTFLILFDPAGKTRLVINNNATPENTKLSRITFTPKKTAQYILRVTTNKGHVTGAYKLIVRIHRKTPRQLAAPSPLAAMP